MDLRLSLLVAVILVVAGIAVIARRRDAARTDAIKKAARLLGLDAVPVPGDFLKAPWAKSHIFHRGRRMRAYHLLRGQVADRDALIFELHFTTGSGNSSKRHRQTLAVISIPGRRLPGFELRPENVFHKIASAMRYQDIDFSSHEEFSKRYLLRGEDEQGIRRLFDTRVLSYFQRNTGWSVEGEGDWIVVYRGGKRPKPEDLRTFLHECGEVARVFEPR